MKRLIQLSGITVLLLASAVASAQPTAYAGPSSTAPQAGYAGPSALPLMSVRNLLAQGRDDQYVRVQGRLVSHKGGEDYEFADQSGRMTVEIDHKYYPVGVRIDQNTQLELIGEFDREFVGESKLDVKQVKVLMK